MSDEDLEELNLIVRTFLKRCIVTEMTEHWKFY